MRRKRRRFLLGHLLLYSTYQAPPNGPFIPDFFRLNPIYSDLIWFFLIFPEFSDFSDLFRFSRFFLICDFHWFSPIDFPEKLTFSDFSDFSDIFWFSGECLPRSTFSLISLISETDFSDLFRFNLIFSDLMTRLLYRIRFSRNRILHRSLISLIFSDFSDFSWFILIYSDFSWFLPKSQNSKSLLFSKIPKPIFSHFTKISKPKLVAHGFPDFFWLVLIFSDFFWLAPIFSDFVDFPLILLIFPEEISKTDISDFFRLNPIFSTSPWLFYWFFIDFTDSHENRLFPIFPIFSDLSRRMSP